MSDTYRSPDQPSEQPPTGRRPAGRPMRIWITVLCRVMLPAVAAFALAGVTAVKAAGQGATLSGDQALTTGQYLESANAQYTLLMQSDGNLVLYVRGRPLWDTRTVGTAATRAAMQSDGNLVLYDATNAALWASNTWGHPGATLGLGTDGNLVISAPGGTTLWATWTADSELLSGEALGVDQYLEPPTRQYSLLMQSDGNLVLYSAGHPLWATGTVGHSGAHVAMQTDGNLVVSSPGGGPIWASNTWRHPGAHLMLGSDGTIMIWGADGTRLWARATGGWNVQLAAPLIRQERNLDCEAAALRIALGSRGTSVSESWILDQIGADTRHALMNGGTVVRWGNPWNTFVGNVDGAEWNGSGYGVYYPPIVVAAERAGHRAIGGQNWSSSDVFNQLELGHPVVIWTMQNFQAATMNHYTAWDGQVIPWRVGEHAVTLTGVNSLARTVTLIDPLDGRQKTFSIAQFLSFWSSFGNMAVAVD